MAHKKLTGPRRKNSWHACPQKTELEQINDELPAADPFPCFYETADPGRPMSDARKDKRREQEIPVYLVYTAVGVGFEF